MIGSYFRNATVCMDANGNGACDPGESSTMTDDGGRFNLPGSGTAVVAEIGVGAIRLDAETGTTTPVSARIVLRAPREAPGVVSLHSTAVVSEMEIHASTYDEAVRKVAASLGVAADKLLADFNKEADPAAKSILKAASSDGLNRIQLALASAKPGEDRRKLLASASGTLDGITNVVIIYLENHSFDNLYGLFPGANGIANALGNPSRRPQIDRDAITVLPALPPVWSAGAAQVAAWAFVTNLPNNPFRIDAPPGGARGADLSVIPPDLVHRFYNNQMQINGSRNDMFVAWSDAGGLAMGYYDGSPMKLWKLARQYTLADNYFQGAFGGSFLNHLWLVCACTPVWDNPPPSRISSVDASGTALNVAASSPRSALAGMPVYVGDLSVTPKLADGNYYAINTVQPPYQPSAVAPAPGADPRLADPSGHGSDAAVPLPAQSLRTIGDALTERNVGWRWYAGGWTQALADRTAIYNGTVPNFQAHHQPFNYFRRFDPTTAAGAAERAAHLKDYADLSDDIKNGSLPPVAFYKPQGSLNQQPGDSDVISGDEHVADVITRLQAGPQWKGMLVVVTYDENGGFWDHVAPPPGDRWGPGTRVPAIIISPFAKKAYVDSVPYDTTSIIKLLTRRFGLEPLAGARKESGDLSNALDMSQ
ncbi:MAG: acid phosphatase [Usitatibacter sp.]